MSLKFNNNGFPISCVSQCSTCSFENKKPSMVFEAIAITKKIQSKSIKNLIKINNKGSRGRLSDRRLYCGSGVFINNFDEFGRKKKMLIFRQRCLIWNVF